MREVMKKTICRTLILAMSVMPVLASADSVITVGAVGSVDSPLVTIDVNTQKAMRAAQTFGSNEVKARTLNNCGTLVDKAMSDAGKNVAVAAAPGDPVKKFNDSINSCLDNIQTISMLFNLPTSFSFTAAFEAILNQLIEKLVSEIIMKICAAATGAWNSAVNNAVNTVNSGINQSGVNTFGTFVSVGTGSPPPPAPKAPAPMAPAPMKSLSTIPGL